MSMILEDRVLETSTTTGTGDFTLDGAVDGFVALDDRAATNDTLPYYIEAVNSSGVPTGEYEVGIGTYAGSNVLDRTTVVRSSNADALVNFSAGTKRVGLGVIAPSNLATRTLWNQAVAPARLIADATSARAMGPSDAGAYIRFTSTGAKTATFDTADGYDWPMEFHITNRAASGNLTLVGTGITLNAPKGGTLVLEPGDVVTVKIVSATVADVLGSTEAA